jgi:hypothetical protein
MGGRPSACISDQNAWKIGQATSGSRAPSSQSRAREMFSGMGMGRVCWRTSGSCSKESAFAFDICVRRLAMYVFWDQRVGFVSGMASYAVLALTTSWAKQFS